MDWTWTSEVSVPTSLLRQSNLLAIEPVLQGSSARAAEAANTMIEVSKKIGRIISFFSLSKTTA
jgi:hypothetical protein